MKYYPLTQKIAYKMARRYPDHVDVNDLIQVGIIGLIEAIDRFQPEKSTCFESYARIRIQGSILDNRRAQDWTPRSVRDRAQLLEQTKQRLQEKYNRMLTNQELASGLNISLRKLEKMIKTSEIKKVLHLEQTNSDNSVSLKDMIADKKMVADEMMQQQEMRNCVQENLKNLSDKEQKIVDMYYYQG